MSMSAKELSDWRGNRADAGRLLKRPAEVEHVLTRGGVASGRLDYGFVIQLQISSDPL